MTEIVQLEKETHDESTTAIFPSIKWARFFPIIVDNRHNQEDPDENVTVAALIERLKAIASFVAVVIALSVVDRNTKCELINVTDVCSARDIAVAVLVGAELDVITACTVQA